MPTRSANQERARRVEQYYIRHGKDKKKTYAHFTDEGMCKKTLYHIIRRHEERGEVTFKKPTGRRVSVTTPETFDKVASFFRENPDLTINEAAKRLGITSASMRRIVARLREQHIDTFKTAETEPRCPTCHQKIDPDKIPAIMRRAKPKKRNTSKSEDNSEITASDSKAAESQ